MSPILEAENIGISFGGLRALQDAGFSARAGEVLAIIGPNGAGKTTLFNVVSGLYRPTSGVVRLDGQDVTGWPPFELARLGLSRTFQNLQIFFRMSAIENVMVGLHLSERTTWLSDLLGLPKVSRQNEMTRRAALAYLERVELSHHSDKITATLAYGDLKRLEIARALAASPRVLLLDEPAAGCNSTETSKLEKLIRDIAGNGTSIILIEHDMRLVMNVSDRVIVLDQGRKLCQGTPEEVRSDSRVIAAYLGSHGTKEAARRATH
jgi:branched-chain amino acid transport system ATP-binding protein